METIMNKLDNNEPLLVVDVTDALSLMKILASMDDDAEKDALIDKVFAEKGHEIVL